jgi:hypothetical protein
MPHLGFFASYIKTFESFLIGHGRISESNWLLVEVRSRSHVTPLAANLRTPEIHAQLFSGVVYHWDKGQTSVSFFRSILLWWPLISLMMRTQSLMRAQSLAATCFRNSARSATRSTPRCALSTATAPRSVYTNGSKTDAWINSQRGFGQRRWQSSAAAV